MVKCDKNVGLSLGSTTNYFVLEMGLKFKIGLFIRDKYQLHIFITDFDSCSDIFQSKEFDLNYQFRWVTGGG
jgi:hypothetical protein